jgi:hypothetical protein
VQKGESSLPQNYNKNTQNFPLLQRKWKMENEKIKPATGESDDDKQEPYYGSTIIVWIRPKPGKFCELQIAIGGVKKTIMVPSSIFRDLMSVISIVAVKIKEV